MQPKRTALLKDEEPPISFYADLVEEGTVEVAYNDEGGLLVTQGTQYEEAKSKKEPLRVFPMIINIVLVMCGLLTTYTIHRIAFEPIPCTCTFNCASCDRPGIQLLHNIRRLWDK